MVATMPELSQNYGGAKTGIYGSREHRIMANQSILTLQNCTHRRPDLVLRQNSATINGSDVCMGTTGGREGKGKECQICNQWGTK